MRELFRIIVTGALMIGTLRWMANWSDPKLGLIFWALAWGYIWICHRFGIGYPGRGKRWDWWD